VPKLKAESSDRFVTLYRACEKSGRVLAPDLFCMMVLMRLGKFAKIPQPDWRCGKWNN
jgi:hypothetical protein